MKKFSDAVIIGTLAASAQAATPSDNVMHMTKEHIQAICSQDPNGLGLKTADGTNICEISTNNGDSWTTLEIFMAAGWVLTGIGTLAGLGYMIRRRKSPKEDVKTSSDAWVAGVPQDPEVQKKMLKSLLESQMTLLKDNFQRYKDGKSDTLSLEHFHSHARKVLKNLDHTESNKTLVRAMGREIDPTNALYVDVSVSDSETSEVPLDTVASPEDVVIPPATETQPKESTEEILEEKASNPPASEAPEISDKTDEEAGQTRTESEKQILAQAILDQAEEMRIAEAAIAEEEEQVRREEVRRIFEENRAAREKQAEEARIIREAEEARIQAEVLEARAVKQAQAAETAKRAKQKQAFDERAEQRNHWNRPTKRFQSQEEIVRSSPKMNKTVPKEPEIKIHFVYNPEKDFEYNRKRFNKVFFDKTGQGTPQKTEIMKGLSLIIANHKTLKSALAKALLENSTVGIYQMKEQIRDIEHRAMIYMIQIERQQ